MKRTGKYVERVPEPLTQQSAKSTRGVTPPRRGHQSSAAQMLVVGIDEVGRGSWAGPLLVVAARATTALPDGLKASKLLTSLQRTALIDAIKNSCELGEGWVQPEEIDKFGLTKAMKIAVSRALINLGASFNEKIIMDGNYNYCPQEYTNVETVVKADSVHPIVSAASIYAKITRDQHMVRLARFHPFYGFEKHVGYGTELHRSTLKLHGVCKIHRLSYKPVKMFL